MRAADMFKHAHRDDAVITAGFAAVIEELEFDAVGDAELARRSFE